MSAPYPQTFPPTIPPRAHTDPFELDLCQFTRAPFTIRDRELAILHDPHATPEGLRQLFNQLPSWQVNDVPDRDFLSNMTHGRASVVRGAYIGSGSFGSVFHATFTDELSGPLDCVMKIIDCRTHELKQQSMVEMAVHAIVSHTCATDPFILERQRAGKMSNVPVLFAAFRVSAPMLGIVRNPRGVFVYPDTMTSRSMPWMVIVMQKVGTLRMFDYIQRIRDRVHPFNTAIALGTYQLASLFDRLGQLIEFNHRDCHSSNVTIEELTESTAPRVCKDIFFFRTCLIDFGYSRVTFRGRNFISSFNRFYSYNPVQDYKNGHDIAMFTWSILHGTCESTNTTIPCTRLYTNSLDKVLKLVLDSTGINFNSDTHSTTSSAMYAALMYAGEPDKLARIYKTENEDRVLLMRSDAERVVNPLLFSNEFVKEAMAIVIRICAVRCSTATAPEQEEAVARFEAQLRDLIMSKEPDSMEMDEAGVAYGVDEDELIRNALA